MAHPHYGLLLITALEKCKLACDIIKREGSSQKKNKNLYSTRSVLWKWGRVDVSVSLFVSLWFLTLLAEHRLLL